MLRKGGLGVTYDVSNRPTTYHLQLVLDDQNFTIPDYISTISERAFENVLLFDRFYIPGNNGLANGVITIESHAFRNTTINSGFAIPQSVVTISPTAFSESIVLPSYRVPT